MAIKIDEMVGIIVGIVVAVIILAAMTPTLIQSADTLGTTIGNNTSLSPLKPLVDNLPLLVLLAFIVGIILAVVKLFKSD